VLYVIGLLLALFVRSEQPSVPGPTFERVHELEATEGVFAYARISPDGKLLAYASERSQGEGRPPHRTIKVLDLRTREILFTEDGIDAYFSPDNERMIFLSQQGSRGSSVAIWHRKTGQISRDIAPVRLGDYFSWARREGRNLITTINSNYYYLEGDRAVLPHTAVQPCPDIGVGQRPIVSRDGRQITAFVRGTVVVRNLTDCNDVFDTGIRGAKADFSRNGRYVAMHAPKEGANGYAIYVVDLKERTVRTITTLSGSSLFPSWTDDDRLSFRYDGPEYRGFMMASKVLDARARPIKPAAPTPRRSAWSDVFPETNAPTTRTNVVVVWAPWSAHMPDALTDAQKAREYFARSSLDVGVLSATDPASWPSDVAALERRHGISLPSIPLAASRVPLTEAHNQIPTTLLFRDGQLVDRKLGPLSFEELRDWVTPIARR
jgi:hypothetical protein